MCRPFGLNVLAKADATRRIVRTSFVRRLCTLLIRSRGEKGQLRRHGSCPPAFSAALPCAFRTKGRSFTTRGARLCCEPPQVAAARPRFVRKRKKVIFLANHNFFSAIYETDEQMRNYKLENSTQNFQCCSHLARVREEMQESD